MSSLSSHLRAPQEAWAKWGGAGGAGANARVIVKQEAGAARGEAGGAGAKARVFVKQDAGAAWDGDESLREARATVKRWLNRQQLRWRTGRRDR